MKNKWRSEEWKETKSTIRKNMPLTPIVNGVVDPFDPCVEAGADAMLEALKKEGFECVFEGWELVMSGSTADAPTYKLYAQASVETKDNLTTVTMPPMHTGQYRRKGVVVFIPEGDDDATA